MTHFIEKVFYINLEHRNDRNEKCLQQLKSVGFKEEQIERFNAIKHNPGAIGCTKSHIECIKLAKKRGYKNIFICEDDIEFTDVTLIRNQLFKFFISKIEYDVLMIGVNLNSYNKYNEFLCKVIDGHSLVGYIVNQSYYDILLSNCMESCEQLLKNDFNWRTYHQFAIDQYIKILQRMDKWFCFNPLSVTQTSDYSDIENKIVNYEQHLLKNIQ